MRFLPDTHIPLRALNAPERLANAVRVETENPDNVVRFSTTSIWEIAIQARPGRSDLDVRAERIASETLERGFNEPVIRWQAACRGRKSAAAPS